MSEQVLGNPHDRIDALEANLNRFIDVVMQSQCHQQIQLDGLTQNQNVMMQAIEQLSRNQTNMMEAIQELASAQRETIEQFQQTDVRIEQMQSEIRGLQTENNRILDFLFNQQQPRDDDEA